VHGVQYVCAQAHRGASFIRGKLKVYTPSDPLNWQ
jgi:hypothetical protein